MLRWRFGGACPLPHKNMACDCESAFYASPISGSWSCFCSDHLGGTSGTVRAFASLGFVADLTLSEMQAEIGKYHVGQGEVRHSGGSPGKERVLANNKDVADRVITKKPIP